MSRRELCYDLYTVSLLTDCMAIVLAAGRITHKTCGAMNGIIHGLWRLSWLWLVLGGNLRVQTDENAIVQAPYLSPGFGDFGIEGST